MFRRFALGFALPVAILAFSLGAVLAAVTQPTVLDSAGRSTEAQAVTLVDTGGNAVVGGYLPTGAAQLTGSSGNVANASAVATLAGAAAKTTYITGFQCTPAGSTGAALVTVAVTGTITGTMSYTVGTPAGATLIGTPLIVLFNPPIPASAVNTSIVVTMPALGAGNTNAACSAQGFRV